MRIAQKHYERVIVLCAFLLFFVNVGCPSTSFSIYQSSIVALPGIGDVGGSMVVAVRNLVTFICMFLTNRYFGVIDLRIGVFLATLSTCAGFVLFGFSTTLPGLCLAAVLAGAGYGFGGMVAATLLIGRWFKGRVGSVSGIMAMGSGVAAIIIPLIAGWIIKAYSLSTSFFVEALFILIVAVFFLLFVRTTPEEIGAERAETKISQKHSTAGAPTLSDVPLPAVSHALMMFALVLLGGVSVSSNTFFGILLTSEGFNIVLAASIISLAGASLTLSKFAVGVACDRFGTIAGSTLFFALLIIGSFCCTTIGSTGIIGAVISAVVLGLGLSLGSSGISLWSIELSSRETLVKNVREFQVSFAFGGFIFNLMPGALCQITGTYTSSYVVFTVLAVLSAVIIIGVYVRHTARIKNRTR